MTLRSGSPKLPSNDDGSEKKSIFSRSGEGRSFTVYSPLLTVISSVLYSFLISYGTLYCAAFSQEIPFSGKKLLWGCLILSAFCAAVFSFRRRLPVYVGAGAAAFLTVFFCREDILAAARTAFFHISDNYRKYIWLIPEYTPEDGTAADEASAFLLCIAAGLVLLTAYAVQRSAPPWPAIGAGAAVLIAGMAVYAQSPSVPHFLMLISAMTLLVLTHSVRRHSPEEGAALTLRLMIPAAALVLLITAIVSPSDYTRPKAADTISDTILSIYDKMLPDTTDPEDGEAWDSFAAETISEEVDMSEIGPKGKSGRWAMSICSNAGGVVYLRGMSYADYTDNKWHILPEEDSEFIEKSIIYSPFDPECTYDGTVQIQSSRIYPVIFMPYYPMTLYSSDNADNMLPHQTYGDAYVANAGDISVYTVDYGTPEHGLALCSGVVNQLMYEDFVTKYLQLPPETEADLFNIAKDAGLTDLPPEQLPYAVAEFVRNSAEYSLDTPKAPEGADFPVWFLTESDTGYCMHYATATALMLRALGIPARYVTGYAVTTVAGEWYNVLEDCAHAWVEFYDPVLGWSVLDATPGDALEGDNEDESESTSTAPDETESTATTTTAPPEEQNSESSVSDSDSKVPSATDDPNAIQQPTQGKRGISILWFAPLLILPLALIITRQAIMRRRQKGFTEGGNNSRAIAMWEQICRLCAASTDSKPEKAAEELALKARFSQHELTKEELAVIAAHMEQLTAQLRADSRLFRTIKNKYIKFLY